MKPIMPLFLLFFFTLSVQAQKIHFGDTSNKWGFSFSYEIASQGHISKKGYTSIGYQTQKSITKNGNTYYLLNDLFSLRYSYVREDTIARIIYGIDSFNSSEYVIFDYNLQAGDTFIVSKKAPGSSVKESMYIASIDSVLLNNVQHKIYKGYYLTSMYSFAFIEGIGAATPLRTMTGQYFGEFIFTGLNTFGLTCFKNQYGIPIDSTNKPFYSCTDTALGIHFSGKQQKTNTVYPQPALDKVTIELPVNTSGHLILYNQLGQKILEKDVTSNVITLQKPSYGAGIYYYRIVDNNNSIVSSGKLVFY